MRHLKSDQVLISVISTLRIRALTWTTSLRCIARNIATADVRAWETKRDAERASTQLDGVRIQINVVTGSRKWSATMI